MLPLISVLTGVNAADPRTSMTTESASGADRRAQLDSKLDCRTEKGNDGLCSLQELSGGDLVVGEGDLLEGTLSTVKEAGHVVGVCRG